MPSFVRRLINGQMSDRALMTAEFVFDSSQSIHEVQVTFRHNNSEEKWEIPLVMFDILFKQHDASAEGVRLRLDVDQVRITLIGEDDVTAEIVLPLREIHAFYYTVVRR